MQIQPSAPARRRPHPSSPHPSSRTARSSSAPPLLCRFVSQASGPSLEALPAV